MDPGALLAAYPAELGLAACSWRRLAAGGSFSGAAVFAGTRFGESLHALKVWPPGGGRADLADCHRAVRTAAAAGLGFVPALRAARGGGTAAVAGGRVAELMAWVPGSPTAAPTGGQLDSLGAGLAALHCAWAASGPVAAADAVPAVARRLAELTATTPSELPAWLASHVAESLRQLRADALVGALLQWTVGDCRLDHALFTGDTLTGLVDFGAVKLDHPAADLARVAQSLSPAGRARLAGAYTANGGAADAAFVGRLADTGLVAAACRWWRVDPGSARLAELPVPSYTAQTLAELRARLVGLAEATPPPGPLSQEERGRSLLG